MGEDMKLLETLHRLRLEHHMTQQDVASYLNISRTTYANYEQGRREPDTYTLIHIAHFYHVSVDYLVGNIKDDLSQKPHNYQEVYEAMSRLPDEELELVKQYIMVLCEKQESKK